MRYVLALILACAVAMPPASAASSKTNATDAKSVSTSKADQGTKTGKRNRQAGPKGLGGIHPLVGSGDY